jgi:hypothetical protein
LVPLGELKSRGLLLFGFVFTFSWAKATVFWFAADIDLVEGKILLTLRVELL